MYKSQADLVFHSFYRYIATVDALYQKVFLLQKNFVVIIAFFAALSLSLFYVSMMSKHNGDVHLRHFSK